MKKLINLTMFDLLKGVAMLGVLFIHSLYFADRTFGSLWYERAAHTVLMPAFFMVSGYWLKKKQVGAGVKNSVDYLLKPLLMVLLIINVIGFVHRAVNGNIREWVDVFLLPSVLMLNKRGARLGPLWFILALFWAWCLYYLVVQIKEEKWQIAIAIVCAFLGGALMPLRLPFQIAPGLIAFFFVYCGYLMKKKKLLEKKIHPFIYVALLVCWGLVVYFGSMDFYSYDVKYGMGSVIGSMCGTFIMVKLFLYANLPEWRMLDGFRWIGRHSMWIMCIHAVEGAVFPWKVLFRFIEQGTLLGTVVQFVLRTCFIIVVCIVLQRWQMYRSRKQREA